MKLTDQFNEGFDDNAVEASKGSSAALPAGKYTMQMEHSEIAFTKDGTGSLLKCRLAVVDGPYKDQLVFVQFNVKNKSAMAVQIGVAELKAMAAACGKPWEAVREDTDQLLFVPFDATLGFEPENINPQTKKPYPPRNKVLRYTKADASVKPKPATPAPRRSPNMTAEDDEVPF